MSIKNNSKQGGDMNNGIVLINNDGYGAPELKKGYQVFTLKGFLIAVTFHIAVIAIYMLVVYVNESNAKDIPVGKDRPIIVDIFTITPPSVNEDEIPPVKTEDIVKQTKDLAALEPKPVKTEDADKIRLKTQDELNNITSQAGREGDSLIASNNIIPGDIKIDNKIDDRINNDIKPPKDVFNVYEVEHAPECINLSQIKSQLVYPNLAIETGIEGRVSVKVLVGENGKVIKTGTLSGNEIFHDEVKDKARNLEFTPGLQNNKPVKVWVTVPFTFKLK